MNIQQLRYIVAIDRFRNFARAADACNISQPTLSAMLVKLEDDEEFDNVADIFDDRFSEEIDYDGDEKN